MSVKKRTLLQRFVGVLVDFLEFIQDSLQEDLVRKSVLADLGATDPGGDFEFPQDKLDGINAYRKAVDSPDYAAYVSAVDDILALVEVFATFVETVANHNDASVDDYLHPLFDLLALNYIRLRMPVLYWYGQPFGFVEATISKHSSARFYAQEVAEFTRDRVILNAFRLAVDFLINPPQAMARIGLFLYGREGLRPLTEDDAQRLSFATLLPLAIGAAFVSKKQVEKLDFLNSPTIDVATNALFGLELADNSPTPLADRISRRALSYAILGTHKVPDSEDQIEVSILTTLLWIPQEHGGPGLYVGIGGAEELESQLSDDWRFKVKLGSDQAFAVLLKGLESTILGPADASATISIERTDEPGEAEVLPAEKGTRLEFGRLAFSGNISSRGAGIGLTASDAALILADKDGDGFVARLLPEGETRIDFDLGLGIDTRRGFYIEGGSGLQAVVPVGKSIGPVTIQTVTLGVGPIPDDEKSGARIELSSAFSARLGAITASVDRLGLRVDLSMPQDGHIPQLDLGVKPPNGIGLVIDGALTGGGYLYFDPANERYAGIVELKRDKISFKAVGLITTRLDDGSKGFSLLLIASAAGFKPIPLGYGFEVTEIGGLVGYNRTARIDLLRDGLKNHTLDTVLFPENPVRDAPRIISTLRSVFPPRRDQYLIGLIARIEWSAKDVLTIDLGLILEVPSPSRFLLLGQLKSRFPTADQALVSINLDVLGEINFSEATISLDASLYDSRLLGFVLTGDAALRMRFRTDPLFVLSIGGLHPNFPAPQNFPRLERLAISLSKKENPRLRAEAYFALTAATYQYGSRLDLYVRNSGFSVEGFLGYDVLIDWTTGQFEASFGAAVTLKWHGKTLLGVFLDATLSGPSNLRIHGKAVFKIWRFSKSVHFDKQLGDEPLPAVQTADPLPELVAALAERRNWATQMTASVDSLVSLRQLVGDDAVLVHPLGEIVVRQQVVPLNTDISRIGGARPSNDRRFTIDRVMLGNSTVTDTPAVRDHFAAGQFIDMTDDERLVRPSFELMDSGLTVQSATVTFGGQSDPAHMVATAVDYETVIVGATTGPARTITPLVLVAARLQAIAQSGAVGRSPLRRTGAAKYRAAIPPPRLQKQGFALANTVTLASVSEPQIEGAVTGLTYTEAVEAKNLYLAQRPDRRDWIQIVPDRELAETAP